MNRKLTCLDFEGWIIPISVMIKTNLSRILCTSSLAILNFFLYVKQEYVPEHDEITSKLVWDEVDRLSYVPAESRVATWYIFAKAYICVYFLLGICLLRVIYGRNTLQWGEQKKLFGGILELGQPTQRNASVIINYRNLICTCPKEKIKKCSHFSLLWNREENMIKFLNFTICSFVYIIYIYIH